MEGKKTPVVGGAVMAVGGFGIFTKQFTAPENETFIETLIDSTHDIAIFAVGFFLATGTLRWHT